MKKHSECSVSFIKTYICKSLDYKWDLCNLVEGGG
jgi:hypothetical protein